MPSPIARREFLLLPFLMACASSDRGADDAPPPEATIRATELHEHVRILADDAMLGRAPGTEGEERTLAYLTDRFRELGLRPGAPDFLQPVPLVEIAPDFDSMQLELGPHRLTRGEDFVAWTMRPEKKVSLHASDLVFAGYGIVAPEWGWNDYEGIDWEGKTAVVLVNDPGFATQDPEVFRGTEMTYYGRWTYKYEEAARQGAAGCLIIHETEPASYGWHVVERSWSVPQMDLERTPEELAAKLAMEGWITRPVAERLCEEAGIDLETLKRVAAHSDFLPVPLGSQASITIQNEVRRFVSHNVVATLPGATHPREHVLYVAHWDHLGVDPSLEGDTIFNGAADNATGVAALLEIAGAYARLPVAPDRSVTFLAVTAEEKGLLGAKHFARQPITSPDDLVAVLAMDILTRSGPKDRIVVIGARESQLGDLAERVARKQGREAVPHPSPESGYFFRSDHFAFARIGVPGLLVLDPGPNDSEYVREHYHRPTDEYDPNWNLEGAALDAAFFFELGRELAMDELFPRWNRGSRFGRIRERDLAR